MAAHQLRKLNVQECELDNAGAAILLGGVRTYRTLTHLSLAYNRRIQADGFRALHQFLYQV